MNKEDIKKFVGNITSKLPSIKEMKDMLSNGSITNVNVINEDGVNALINQSKTGSIEAMKFILLHETFININQIDKYGNSALMYAVIFSEPDKVKLLLDYGADNKNEQVIKLIKTTNDFVKKFSSKLSQLPEHIQDIYNKKKQIITMIQEKSNHDGKAGNDYGNKYLKYKNKYLKLKKQLGGSTSGCGEYRDCKKEQLEEARKQLEEEARKQLEEARKQLEEEARKQLEEEARKQLEEEARKQLEQEFKHELENYIDEITMAIEEKEELKNVKKSIADYNNSIKKDLEYLDNPMRVALREESKRQYGLSRPLVPLEELSCKICKIKLSSTNRFGITTYDDIIIRNNNYYCNPCSGFYASPCSRCNKTNTVKVRREGDKFFCECS